MLKVRKLQWSLLTGILIVVMSGCTSTAFYEQVSRFDAVAAERNIVLRKGKSVDGSPSPSPVYSPSEVVQIQLDALQRNNANDDGIEIVFRFASPRNKRMTGPLWRFEGIIKSPSYRPMLGHQSTHLEDAHIDGREALQRVHLVDQLGNEIVYLFVLTKQSEQTCGGCWMTDIVVIESVTPTQSI